MTVDAAYAAHCRGEVETILGALRAEAARWGVDLAALRVEVLRFERQRDPSSGDEALAARWRGSDCAGHAGQLTLRGDGHVYAECDLLVDHPQRPQCWIEAATVWGILPALRSEARLIDKPADDGAP